MFSRFALEHYVLVHLDTIKHGLDLDNIDSTFLLRLGIRLGNTSLLRSVLTSRTRWNDRFVLTPIRLFVILFQAT